MRYKLHAVMMLAVAVAAPVAWASADQAAELLARAKAINTACDILPTQDREDLSDFVARAEIDLAAKASVKTAQEAISRGRAAGKATPCDAAARELVVKVLSAARAASALADYAPRQEPATTAVRGAPDPALASDQSQSMVVAEPAEPKSLARKTSAAKPKPQPTPPARVRKQLAVASGLGSYAAIAQTYYAERRCRQLSKRSINALYAEVLAAHEAAVANYGASAVGAALRRAEARAKSVSCG